MRRLVLVRRREQLEGQFIWINERGSLILGGNVTVVRYHAFLYLWGGCFFFPFCGWVSHRVFVCIPKFETLVFIPSEVLLLATVFYSLGLFYFVRLHTKGSIDFLPFACTLNWLA